MPATFMFHPSEIIPGSCGNNNNNDNNAIFCLQNAIISIAEVEEAYKCENRSKGVIEEAIQFLSFDELDGTDATEDVDENRLLPAMNKLWPYLIICLRNKVSVVCFVTSDSFPLCKTISCLFSVVLLVSLFPP